MKLDLNIEVNHLDLADSLTSAQAAELIGAIDLAQADWLFTHDMCKHFLRAMLVLIKEDADEGVSYMNELKEILK